MIDEINSSQNSWVASKEWVGTMTVAEAKGRASTSIEPVPDEVPRAFWGALEKTVSIPTEFDSRKEWPNCIHPIRNQEKCGSCWAFGATEVLSDRYCIKEGVNVVLSPEYLLSCDHIDQGCNGGNLMFAWLFQYWTGVASDDCVPYTSGDGKTGTCPTTCKNGSEIKLYKSNFAHAHTSVSSIQMDIIANGPLEAAFTVYQDFMAYKSGVYVHTTGQMLGGHAVKIVGWGNNGSTDYWIVANSWGTSWGEEGFFNIAFGQCGIDSGCYSATPK